MYHNIHSDFILTPILNILEESVNACCGIGEGIETQPLCEYIMQSTFLKMTGASEQKMKCICWNLATNDFRYRYDYLGGYKNYGECSDYKSKDKVYSDIIGQIGKFEDTFDAKNFITNKKVFLSKIKERICDCINNTPMEIWQQSDYMFFMENLGNMLPNQICCDNGNGKKGKSNDNSHLFGGELKNDYDLVVYYHRNRCAHNLTSYQENLPSLRELVKEEYRYENYFYRYYILVVLDEIFMLLFKKYMAVYEVKW